MSKFCKITTDKRIMDAPNPLRIVISNPTDERYRYEGSGILTKGPDVN